MTSQKPAWYAIEGRGAISDSLTLLHPPYTLWHLSYVIIGISLAPIIYPVRSIATLVAFFLGLGIGAHALDETMGNPLKTKLTRRELYSIGFSSIAIATAIGLYYALSLSLLLLPIIIIEVFFALVYNLEMFGKRFHNSPVFALSWGVIPFLTGYFINSLSLSPGSLLASVAVGLLTYVQRTLSLQARLFRRNMDVESLKLSNGDEVKTSAQELIAPAEKSLKALTVMIFVLAVALVLQRVV
jgi:hypothetical protein